jgi:hypothetical protein
MRLGEIMARYSRIRVGTWQDNASILKFLKSIPTTTSEIVFRFERKPDYFRYLRYQSRKPFVFTFHNDDGSLGGVASLCLKNLFFKGQMASMIYMSDVRMSPSLSRRTRIDWRAWYSDIVRHAHEIEEFNHPQFLFTLVMDGNEAPLRAFARGKSDVVYEHFAAYQTVNILGRRPWVKGAKQAWKIRRAEAEDLPALRTFLHKQNVERPLGHHFTLDPWEHDGPPVDELQRRLNVWDDFGLDSFVIAENSQGRIVGCVAPWSFDRGRRLIVENLPQHLRILGSAMPVLGRPRIANGKSLQVLNLTHLEVDSELRSETRQSVFASMVDHIWQLPEMKDYHILSLADFEGETLLPALSNYIVQKTPASLYSVTHKDLPAFRDETYLRSRAPAFEIAIP